MPCSWLQGIALPRKHKRQAGKAVPMGRNMLVVYYSWSNGNTEKVARRLAEVCGADVARIETVEPYPDDYDQTVRQGQDEVNAGLQPEIEPLELDPADYDVIAVGTPTWWYTMAPAVSTFLASASWAGKTVVPFMTNGGWPGSVIDDIEEACAGATFGPALEVQFDSEGGPVQKTPQRVVDAWAERVRALL